jgi:FAD/FMN-containing dehydrogenase
MHVTDDYLVFSPKLDKTLYYGSNYPRLVELKEKLDPGNIFANPQSVGSGLAK